MTDEHQPAIQPLKPLGIKAYGHIPHLPGSRMGPGDHHCHEGQAQIATFKTRDRHDYVTVTVKVDGTCVAVARIDGILLPLIRAGYPAVSSKYEQHRLFHNWVMERQARFLDLLCDGERVIGEWLAQAHGTRYRLMHEPFLPFDIMAGARRLPYDEVRNRAYIHGFIMPGLISGNGLPVPVEDVQRHIAQPWHGELDPVEGAVWRVERKGQFDFMCKWVRPDKVDGCFLPELNGGEVVWNWRPDTGGGV